MPEYAVLSIVTIGENVNSLTNMKIAVALAAYGMAGSALAISPRPDGGLGDWMDRNHPRRRISILSGSQRNPDSLKRKGWPEMPCGAPPGWFWKRDHGGKRLYRLYREPVGEGRTFYDASWDRYIVESGHGYRKPTYLNPDEFKARQDGRYF